MKNILFPLLVIFNFAFAKAQVGINTTTPEGALDIVSENTGMVVPRVSNIDNVTTPSGNPPVDGTIVYDLSRNQMCMRMSGLWLCMDVLGVTTTDFDTAAEPLTQISNYIKASNTDTGDFFGNVVSLSTDGNYMAVGARGEDSNSTGINGNQADNSVGASGAVYVFMRSGATWVQVAYIKASNTDTADAFGISVSLNDDGTRLAIGASNEDSSSTGINGNQANNDANISGAAYVFERVGATWSQQAYIKASNTESFDFFGVSLDLSGDGNTLAVSANFENSSSTGINGDETNNDAANSGAVYVFENAAGTWSQQAYIKASNAEAGDNFGSAIALSGDGNTLVVTALGEDGSSTGINGDQTTNDANISGAAYVFERVGATWSQQAYIKASNAETLDAFGSAVSISASGNILAVGANREASASTGVNGNQSNNDADASGAAYIFVREAGAWTQEAYIKASNAEANEFFGDALSLSANGTRLIVGAVQEDSGSIGIDGNQTDNTANASGAGYSYLRVGTNWFPDHYIKASNTEAFDFFGSAIAISGDGNLIAIGTIQEDSNATGVGGNQTNNAASLAGAVYIIE